ncbi:MAG: hypothetical protein GX900_06785 [Clostridiaceae bacterium]|nr:hypothetical protein [Clostridiaceae bacterium]
MHRYILSDDDDIVIKESQFKKVGYELLYYHTFCYLNLPKHLIDLGFSKQEIIMIIVLLFAQRYSKVALNTETAKIRELLHETGLEEIILSKRSSLRERKAHGSLQRPETQDLLRKAEIQKYIQQIDAELRRVSVLGEVKGFFALQHKLGKGIPSLVSDLHVNYPRIVTVNMAFLLSTQGRTASETPLFRERTQYVRVFPRKGFVMPRRISNIPMKTWRTECYRKQKGEPRFRKSKVNPVDIILLRHILTHREYFLRLNLRESEMPLVFCRDRAAPKDKAERNFTAGLKTKHSMAPDFTLSLFSRAYNSLFSRGIAAFRRALNQMTIGTLRKTRKKRRTTGSSLQIRIDNSNSSFGEKHRDRGTNAGRRRYSVTRKGTATQIDLLRAHPLFLYFSLPLLRRLESDCENKAKDANRIIVAARLAISLLERLLALNFEAKRNQILKLFLVSADKKNLLRENNGLELLYEHLKWRETRIGKKSKKEYGPNRNNLYAIQGLTALQKIVQRGILIRLLETKALLHERNLDFPFSGVYVRKILLADIEGKLTAIRQIGGLSRETRKVFAALGIEVPPSYQIDPIPKRGRRGKRREQLTAKGILTTAGRKKREKRLSNLPGYRESGKCFISLYADRCPFYSTGEECCGEICVQRIPIAGPPFVSRTLAKKDPDTAKEEPVYGLTRCEKPPEGQTSRYLPG